MRRMRNLIRGYTLIEILVVLFIISIVTGVGLLSIRYNENKQLESLANKMSETLQLAEEQALLQPMVLGLSIDQEKMQFFQSEKNEWLPIQDQILKQQMIPGQFQMVLATKTSQAQEIDKKPRPQIIISTNGDITPFTIYLGKKGEKPKFAISGDADGTISTTAL